MKTPKRIHLVTSPVPLQEKTALEAVCGHKIGCAQWKMHADSELAPNIRELVKVMRGICSDCRTAELNERYVYGVSEFKDEQEIEAA